jgi:hypothetical protein
MLPSDRKIGVAEVEYLSEKTSHFFNPSEESYQQADQLVNPYMKK